MVREFMWGRLAACGGLVTRLSTRGRELIDALWQARRRPGRLPVGRRLPICPTQMHYSLRRAMAGSTRTARHAGAMQASTETARRRAITAINVGTSNGGIPKVRALAARAPARHRPI